MRIERTETIERRGVSHEILIACPERFADVDEAIRADEQVDKEWPGDDWDPDNHARFKSRGAALRWLKVMLGKPGWPMSTRWLVRDTSWVDNFGRPQRAFDVRKLECGCIANAVQPGEQAD